LPFSARGNTAFPNMSSPLTPHSTHAEVKLGFFRRLLAFRTGFGIFSNDAHFRYLSRLTSSPVLEDAKLLRHPANWLGVLFLRTGLRLLGWKILPTTEKNPGERWQTATGFESTLTGTFGYAMHQTVNRINTLQTLRLETQRINALVNEAGHYAETEPSGLVVRLADYIAGEEDGELRSTRKMLLRDMFPVTYEKVEAALAERNIRRSPLHRTLTGKR
jgi:hypothetical protein